MRRWLPILIVMFGFVAVGSPRADAELHPTVPLKKAAAVEIVTNLKAALLKYYVNEEKAQTMAADLERRLAAGEYDLPDTRALAKKLTDDTRAIAGDKHLNVFTTPPGAEFPEFDPSEPTEPTPDELRKAAKAYEPVNYGISRTDRLAGNIGLLELQNFWNGPGLKERLEASFKLLAATDALIVDVRQNGGGDPQAVALLVSYFLKGKTHVNSFVHRGAARIEDFYSDPSVAPKYLGKPVIVLTSKYTFSGAEEFAYDMQALKLATIIGEVTGGGANPGTFMPLADGMAVQMPYAEARNPITRTNWEGVGVHPDIELSSDSAFYQAHLKLLKEVLTGQEARKKGVDPNYGAHASADENRLAQDAIEKKLAALATK